MRKHEPAVASFVSTGFGAGFVGLCSIQLSYGCKATGNTPAAFEAQGITERFWRRVDSSGGPDACWPWKGGGGSTGYGQVHLCQRKPCPVRALTHRLAYELAKGPIPPGLLVRHSCHRRICCNPAHLSVGTVADNSRDMVEAGRSFKNKGELHGCARLTRDGVIAIRRARAAGVPIKALAAEYGVKEATVSAAALGVTWPHVEGAL